MDKKDLNLLKITKDAFENKKVAVMNEDDLSNAFALLFKAEIERQEDLNQMHEAMQ